MIPICVFFTKLQATENFPIDFDAKCQVHIFFKLDSSP